MVAGFALAIEHVNERGEGWELSQFSYAVAHGGLRENGDDHQNPVFGEIYTQSRSSLHREKILVHLHAPNKIIHSRRTTGV